MSAASTTPADNGSPPGPRSGCWTHVALVLLAVGLSAVVHRGILRNYFFTDDFLNLYRIKNAGLFEYLLTPHGGHMLVLRNALFYLTARAFDTTPPPYFLTVLLTHLVNVALLYAVVWQLTRSARLACFGATLWGTSPIHAGALGWYSVYGHVVAATFLLVILYVVARAAAAGRAPTRGALALCYVLALLATVSFGVGIGFATTLPLVVAWLSPEARRSARWGIPLWSLFLAVPLLYLGFFFLHGLFFGEGLETPNTLTALVLRHWATIPVSLVQLMAYGLMQLGLGFTFEPRFFSSAMAYAVTGALLLCGVLVARRAPAPVGRALAAMALLTLGCYAIIVMGRVIFFESYSDAVMAIQPRYHYAGLIPLTVMLCLLLGQLSASPRLRPWAKSTLLVLWLAFLVTTYSRSRFVIDHHDLAKRQTEQVLRLFRTNVAAQPAGTDVYIENRSFAALAGGAPRHIFPGWAAVFVIYYPRSTVDGRRVHFVDPQLGVLVASARGRRSAGLIVPSR